MNARLIRTAIAAAAAAMATACATNPPNPAVADARAQLSALESDPQVASAAPLALKDAEDAVAAAEQAQHRSNGSVDHYVYLADRKIEEARVLAQGKISEQQM